MYSILDEVDKYIKENGIPFKEIVISYDYLPSYINHVILEKVREKCLDRYDFGSPEYTLSYDKNGTIYLMAHDFYNKVNICITNGKLDKEFDYPITLVTERRIIREAMDQEYLQKEREVIRNVIDTKYSHLDNLERIKLVNTIINSMLDTTHHKLRENNINIEDVVPIKEEIAESVAKINNYIGKLNENYISEQIAKEEEKKQQGIYYNEPDSDEIDRKPSPIPPDETRERHNPIIPVSDRISILENYYFIYYEYAYSKQADIIDYINYLYQISDNKYAIIMEPYSGTKHTKIAIIESNDKITNEEFRKLVKYYLELSYLETNEAPNVVRCNHTTLDAYEQVVDYTIAGNNKISNQYFKKRIKTIKEQ